MYAHVLLASLCDMIIEKILYTKDTGKSCAHEEKEIESQIKSTTYSLQTYFYTGYVQMHAIRTVVIEPLTLSYALNTQSEGP
jgi:hypothetical protein